MKKLYIFDFDGTLVDTFTDAGIYYNKALSKYNFPEHKLDEYKYLMGGSLEEVVTRILPVESRTEENINNVKNEYWSTYPNSLKEKTKPYDGIVELLEKMQKENLLIAINTNKKQMMVEKMCENFFSNIKFVCIAGNNGEYLPKPNPGGIEKILSVSNISREDAIYIGDSKYDFETSKNANMDAILVKWGAYHKEDEQYKCIKFIASNVDNLSEFVMKNL